MGLPGAVVAGAGGCCFATPGHPNRAWRQLEKAQDGDKVGAQEAKETLLSSQAANPPSAGICRTCITLRFPEKASSILLRNAEHKKLSGEDWDISSEHPQSRIR